MSKINDGGPAQDLSLRDYFAAAALQGIVAHPGMEPDDASPSGCAELAYRFADAMLAARDDLTPSAD